MDIIDTKNNLKYKHLSSIDNELFTQIKLVFISTFTANNPVIIFITKSDEVYAIGLNQYRTRNRLDRGFRINSTVIHPTLVPELCGIGIKNIAIRPQYVVGVTESGEIYTWGYDYLGQFGFIGPNTYNKATKMPLMDSISKIACTNYSTYMLTKSGQIYGFGYWGHNGQTYSIIAKKVDGLNFYQMTDLSCGQDFIIALNSKGQVFSWGVNNNGELGLGNNTPIYTPQIINMNALIKKVSCGNNHSLMLTVD